MPVFYNFRDNSENLVSYSTYNASTWSNVFPAGATITTGISAPDGSTNAVRFSCNNTTNALLRVTFPSFTPNGSDTYTSSFFVRKISGTGNASTDLADGNPSADYSSQLITNSWVRVVTSAVPTATAKTFIDLFSDGNTNYVLDFWGVQIEKKSAVGAYVPTNGTVIPGGDGLIYSFDDVFVPADLFREGTLWAWGVNNRFGFQPSSQLGNAQTANTSTPVTTFSGGTNWKQVSAAYRHTAAIKTDGTLWTWGYANNGILGIGLVSLPNLTRSTPVTTFAGGTNWKQVSAGTLHTAAIKTDGTLWTWGAGNQGRLGNGITSGIISTPSTTFAGGTNWKQVSCGYQHAAAIKTDGTLWTWGNGNSGRLGNSSTTNVSTPVTTFSGGTNWKQVSCGVDHTVAIKTDGTLWTWGSGASGQLGKPSSIIGSLTPVTTFAGGTNWADTATTDPEDLYTLSAGQSFTAAIKTDGTLWTWGVGSSGQLGNAQIVNTSTPVTTFSGGTNWKQISCGSNHTAAIKTDGTLWTWSFGNTGQLGTNDFNNRSTPVTTFAGGTNWKQVSAASGGVHTAAIKTDGTLWTWGGGIGGRLGNSSTTNVSTPVTTSAGGTNWKQVSAGDGHTAAIKTDGTLWTWGGGGSGQLGRPVSTVGSVTPVTTFAGGTNWADTATGSEEELYTLSAGRSYTAAIKTDGTLWTWGYGGNGQLGNATTSRSTPVTTFAGGTNWKQVSASVGGVHTAAIKTDGTLWTWGASYSGRLGNGSIASIGISTPITTFAGGTNWKQVSCGNLHTAAIKTDGTLWTWGRAFEGQLGTNNVTGRSTPVTTFAGGTNWKQVSAGVRHTAAIKTDGTLWTWGYASTGQLGNGAIVSAGPSTPVTTFAGGTNWKQVSCGNRHTAAIKTDGTLWIWGLESDGILGNGVTTFSNISTPVTTFAGGTNWKQVSCGYQHTAAIKTDGTLWTWGFANDGRLGTNDANNRSTPVTTFAGGTNWKQVSGGGFHTVALSDDGVNKVLYTFGYNSSGQLGINPFNPDWLPSTTFAGGTNWKQVSSGSSNTSAIKTDGTLWTWGSGSNGRLGNSSTTNVSTPITTFAGGTNWKQVSAGGGHTAAIKTDGTLWTWGTGSSGRLGTNDLDSRSTPVTTFAGGTNWKQVSVGYRHTVALSDNGVNKVLYTFGYNSNGELGINPTSLEWIPGQTFAGGTNWKQVSCGYQHTAAIKTDGTLWTWGRGYNGQIGNATTTSRSTPVTTFTGGTNWKQVSGGNSFTSAIKTDGTLWTWGDANYGRLGNGTNSFNYISTPVTTFAGGNNWKQVSAAGLSSQSAHTAAVTYEDPVI